MGRLVQIEEFMDEDGDIVDKEHLRNLIRTNQALKNAAHRAGATQIQIVKGEVDECKKQYRDMLMAGKKWVRWATRGWDQRLIKRSNDSVAAGGARISKDVPPLTVVDAYIKIPQDELERMDESAGHVEDE